MFAVAGFERTAQFLPAEFAGLGGGGGLVLHVLNMPSATRLRNENLTLDARMSAKQANIRACGRWQSAEIGGFARKMLHSSGQKSTIPAPLVPAQ